MKELATYLSLFKFSAFIYARLLKKSQEYYVTNSKLSMMQCISWLHAPTTHELAACYCLQHAYKCKLLPLSRPVWRKGRGWLVIDVMIRAARSALSNAALHPALIHFCKDSCYNSASLIIPSLNEFNAFSKLRSTPPIGSVHLYDVVEAEFGSI